MTKIYKEEVKQIAYLARLEFDESGLNKYQIELSTILDYIDLINQANVSDIEPMTNVTRLSDVFREDIKLASELSRDEVLLNAPDKKDGYIKVKSVLD